MRWLPVAAALAALVLAPAAAAQAPAQVLPGVTVAQSLQFTPRGPVRTTVITGPRPGGLYSLGPVLAGGTVGGGLEPLTQIEQDVSAGATAVGIDGDLFSPAGGPSGVVISGGLLQHPPVSTRASIGLDGTGTLQVGRVAFYGTWRGTGQRRTLNGLNQPPVPGAAVLFTPAWGTQTPAVAGAAQVVLEPFPAAAPNTDLSAKVTAVGDAAPVAIPSDGAVLMATGSLASTLTAEAPVGTTLDVRLGLQPSWTGIVSALGGGPQLLRNGVPVFAPTEDFPNAFLTLPQARAAIGQTADGRILMVVVDGGRAGWSIGLTNYELAQAMQRLGAVTASALAGGDNAAAAFDGQLLTRPTQGPQPIKEALLLTYAGVVEPPPTLPVVTGDPTAQTETLAYKVVRPSTVNAVLVAPDGTQTVVDSGLRQPGTYSFQESTFPLEGTWHWTVNATDDLGRASTADSTFRVDGTVRGLAATAGARGAETLAFTLSREASIQVTVETPGGVPVRTLAAAQLAPGDDTITWDGLLGSGGAAYPGSYVAVLAVTSAVGTSDLQLPFTFRR